VPAVIVTIAVVGVALPSGLWLFARWRMSRPAGPPHHGKVDQWLISEFGLGHSDRARVRLAVLSLQRPDKARVREPPPLPPELLAPARALAARVLAGHVPGQRLSRGLGWSQLLRAACFAGLGVFVLATGWGGERSLGALSLLPAGLYSLSGWTNAVLKPRRLRRNAERVLRRTSTEHPAPPRPPAA
jgi:hypothetical protein